MPCNGRRPDKPPEMTTPFNGADAMVRMLQLNGLKHIFGLCGDTRLPLYDAMARFDHGVDRILNRDERREGYMADAYARVTGKVGVCEGPSGGGATYLVPAGWSKPMSRPSRCWASRRMSQWAPAASSR
jgi:glyoxylate carboligase